MNDILDSLKKENFNLEIIKNDDEIKKYCCICDPELISPEFEYLNLWNIDETDGIYGFFITRDNIVYASCIVDLNCNSVCSRSKMEKGMLKEYAEISLLCSNYKKRVKGLTSKLLNYVKSWVKKNNKKYLVLTVANINKNQTAVSFYKGHKFEQLETSSNFIYFIKE